MAYPDKPSQYIIVLNDDGNQIDLFDTYGMALLDGWTNPTPEVKTNFIDIPGGHGSIDLTEASTGDVSFSDRQQTFPFVVPNVQDVNQRETDIKNFLHGKTRKFMLSWDTYMENGEEKMYVYEGRFLVTDLSTSLYLDFFNRVITLTLSVTSKPFKRRNDVVDEFSAIGGVLKQYTSGRQRVPLYIGCSNPVHIINISTKEEFDIKPGKWTLSDVIFHQGVNEIWFSTYDIYKQTWGGLEQKTEYYEDYDRDANGNIIYSVETATETLEDGTTQEVSSSVPKMKQYSKVSERTWGDIASVPIYQLEQESPDDGVALRTWGQMEKKTHAELSAYTHDELMYTIPETQDIKDIKIKYEVGEI